MLPLGLSGRNSYRNLEILEKGSQLLAHRESVLPVCRETTNDVLFQCWAGVWRSMQSL
jgi:hypothetical protein